MRFANTIIIKLEMIYVYKNNYFYENTYKLFTLSKLNTKGLFGCLPKTPRHATHFASQVWRPNRPPHLRRGVASNAGNQQPVSFHVLKGFSR
jgi:hypothetical protein